MPTPRAALALTVTLTLTVGLPGAVAAEPVGASGPPRPSVAVPAPPPSGDFNGDGFADVAIGVPGESVGSASHAGAVHVLYGSASGITSAGNQFWTQNSSNVPNAAETGDAFGFAVTAGDFNGDGFADLAVGVPDEDFGGLTDPGMVQLFLGSMTGLKVGPDLSEDTSGMPTNPASGDHFGSALASGDFDGDGVSDLAVGVPGKTVSGHGLAGATIVLYGSATSGLTATGSQLWTQDTSGVAGSAGANAHFGFALAAGDLDGDGFADLAVGAPGETVGSASYAGAAVVLYGTATGLKSANSQLWDQNSSGIAGSAESQDDFGYALAIADFDGDGFGDLAVGVPFEDEGYLDAGGVNVIYGSATGLTSTGNQFWALDSPSMPGGNGTAASFGFALSAANFDGDAYADLAIGDPGHIVSGHRRAGAANVLYGSMNGLTTARAQFWSQDASGINGGAESGDEFGFAVATGDAGNGGQGDLFAGIPFEDVGSVKDAGAIAIIYGSATGLTSTGNQALDQDSSGIADSCERADQFGAAVASGWHGAPPH